MRPMLSMASRRLVVTLMVSAFLIVGFLPMRYLASPRWDVWVVTRDGHPVSGAQVRLVYQNFSAEGRSHELTITTDGRGHVLFEERYERASLLQRAYYTIASATGGVHASFGRHAYVLAFGRGYEGEAVQGKYVADWRGSPASTSSTIIVSKTSD
jgi:hypothetical protein